MEDRLQSGARVAPAGDTARQFLCDRYHPAEPEALKALNGGGVEPVLVWVFPVPRPPDFGCECAVVYRVTDQSNIEWSALTGNKADLDRPLLVCTCQGHFIE